MEDILHPEVVVTQNNLENWIRMCQVKNWFLLLCFQKSIVSCCIIKKFLMEIFLNLTNPVSTANSSSLAASTLHTAHCKLRTAPAPANTLESEHVNFIQHIEHCRLHTTWFYCILKMYHFALQTSRISCVGLRIYIKKNLKKSLIWHFVCYFSNRGLSWMAKSPLASNSVLWSSKKQ